MTASLSGLNGFAGDVAVTISGLSTGVVASPASFHLGATNPLSQQVTFTLATSAVPGTDAVTFQGVSGSLQESASGSLSIEPYWQSLQAFWMDYLQAAGADIRSFSVLREVVQFGDSK